MTVPHKAIIGKKEAVISHLLRKGASPNVRDKVCILLYITSFFDPWLVYSLRGHGFIYLLSWQDGATPLHYAIQVGAMQTVKLLLIKYKADVNIADNVSIDLNII